MTAIWDERLISRQRAADMVAGWPLMTGLRENHIYLDCGRCSQAVMLLASGAGSFVISSDGLISAVLRHMVMAHDVPLSGAGKENDGRGAAAAAGPPGQVPARPGGAGGRAQPGPDPVGQPDQEAGPGRAGRAEGGEHA